MCNCCDIDEPVHWRHATHYVTTLGVTPSHIPYAKRRTQESGARKQATRLAPGSEKNVASRVACRTHNNLLARATLRSKVECYRTSRLGLTELDEDLHMHATLHRAAVRLQGQLAHGSSPIATAQCMAALLQ